VAERALSAAFVQPSDLERFRLSNVKRGGPAKRRDARPQTDLVAQATVAARSTHSCSRWDIHCSPVSRTNRRRPPGRGA